MNAKEEKGLIDQSGSDARSLARKPSPPGKRSYSPPQLWEYGRLADWTLQLSTYTEGDEFGGSYASF